MTIPASRGNSRRFDWPRVLDDQRHAEVTVGGEGPSMLLVSSRGECEIVYGTKVEGYLEVLELTAPDTVTVRYRDVLPQPGEHCSRRLMQTKNIK